MSEELKKGAAKELLEMNKRHSVNDQISTLNTKEADAISHAHEPVKTSEPSKMDKAIKMGTPAMVLIVVLAIAYYLAIFVPKQANKQAVSDLQQQEIINLQKQLLEKSLDVVDASTTGKEAETKTQSAIKPSSPAQGAIINCKVKLYDVKATKEECNQVIVLESRAQDKIDGIYKETKQCIEEAEEKADSCYQEAVSINSEDALKTCKKALDNRMNNCDNGDEIKQIMNDLGKAIDRIIK